MPRGVEEAERSITKYVMYVQELYFECSFQLGNHIVIVADVPHVNRAIEFTFTGIMK